MKKIISLILMILMIFSCYPDAFAEELPWQAEYRRVITNSNVTNFILLDVTGDKVPEMFSDNYGKVFSFYYKDGAAIKASENSDIPFVFFKNLKYARNNTTDEMAYIGQISYQGLLYTYKMSFPGNVPVLEVVAQENLSTGAGNFKGDAEVFSNVADVSDLVSEYLENYTQDYITAVSLTTEEIRTFGREGAATRFFARYNLLTSLSDNQINFSATQREKIKKAVGEGTFLEFNRISVLSDTSILVEFFVNDTQNEKLILPYAKRWALIDEEFTVVKSYRAEREIDAANLSALIAVENAPSNINPDYDKCESFRGIDDYVTYLSQLITSAGEVNENGKKSIAQFMEYATNKCSRTGLKAQDNTLTITKSSVSIISENASICMGQLVSLCNSKNITQIRTARTIPELVCGGLDFNRPIRIEFEEGVASALSSASGLRIMLDARNGIYLNTAELAVLDENTDTFCIEYEKNDEDYSIVFTDRNNRVIDTIVAPVWFIVPAKYDYSSVIASYEGGTDNRGGQFDEKLLTIEFSALRSGNYQVVENDITINDIDDVSLSKSEAIRFLVSKGVFALDRKNNFYPAKNFTRYDFAMVLVKMFYQENPEAECTYLDVPESSKYYSYVATAEASGLTVADEDGNFSGNAAVTKEHLLALCGKILADKKGYQYPDKYIEYLQFADKVEISASSVPYIAIAVQCGLAENSGELNPNDPVTRADSAEVLYKTYMLLYDASPVTTSLSVALSAPQEANTMKDFGAAVRTALCAGITAAFAAGIFVVGKWKKKEE